MLLPEIVSNRHKCLSNTISASHGILYFSQIDSFSWEPFIEIQKPYKPCFRFCGSLLLKYGSLIKLGSDYKSCPLETKTGITRDICKINNLV